MAIIFVSCDRKTKRLKGTCMISINYWETSREQKIRSNFFHIKTGKYKKNSSNIWHPILRSILYEDLLRINERFREP